MNRLGKGGVDGVEKRTSRNAPPAHESQFSQALMLTQFQLFQHLISQPCGYLVELLDGLGKVEPEDECGEFVDEYVRPPEIIHRHWDASSEIIFTTSDTKLATIAEQASTKLFASGSLLGLGHGPFAEQRQGHIRRHGFGLS